MNTDTNSHKEKINRILTVIGFIAVIILIAWLAVQIVRFLPNAFSSLASLSEGISQHRESLDSSNDGPLIVESNVASTTSGEPITLSWEKDGRVGRYAFSHGCRDGLIVEMVDNDGLRTLSCGVRYDLGDMNTITIVTDSPFETPVEVPYIISFIRTNDTEPVRVGETTVTITNDDAPVAVAPDNGDVLGESDSVDDEEEAPVAPAPTPTVTRPVYTYSLPVSDPNGYVDLKATFIATGNINGRTFKAGSLKQEEDGAIQFEIQNVGTKTSGRWTYSVLLPDNETYVSPQQAPLLPTERVIISIGFPTDDDSSHTFVAIAVEKDDVNLTNNTFRQVTRLLK